MDIQAAIKSQVTSNPVVLYMKGSPKFPQCGFSGLAIQILQACGVQNLVAVDVLADPAIRDGIKVYANISGSGCLIGQTPYSRRCSPSW